MGRCLFSTCGLLHSQLHHPIISFTENKETEIKPRGFWPPEASMALSGPMKTEEGLPLSAEAVI